MYLYSLFLSVVSLTTDKNMSSLNTNAYSYLGPVRLLVKLGSRLYRGRQFCKINIEKNKFISNKLKNASVIILIAGIILWETGVVVSF